LLTVYNKLSYMWFLRVKKKRVSVHYQKHKQQARILIHSRLEYFAPLCEVNYKRVAIRNQRRRWGSCSSSGNLNFNYRLLFLPLELADYVIVHELCHLKEMNHSSAFWKEVAKVLPDYERLERELKVLERELHSRMKMKSSATVDSNI
jgi:predicted metal-dependent hydrolase